MRGRFRQPVVRDMLPEWPSIISILFFCWLSGFFLLPEELEHGLDMSENYVWHGVFEIAERSVWSGHVRKPRVLQSFRGCGEKRLD